MGRPQAYDPADGYRYQILCRNLSYSRAFEHCDYAVDRSDREHLLSNYRQAYGAGWEFKVITLPRKYWPPRVDRNTLVGTKEQIEKILNEQGGSPA